MLKKIIYKTFFLFIFLSTLFFIKPEVVCAECPPCVPSGEYYTCAECYRCLFSETVCEPCTIDGEACTCPDNSVSCNYDYNCCPGGEDEGSGNPGDCLSQGAFCLFGFQCCSGDCNWFNCATPPTTTTTITTTTTTIPTSSTTTTTTIPTSSTTTTTTIPEGDLEINFGITRSINPWIQTTGADLRIEGSGDFGEMESYIFNVPDPSTTTCGVDPTYASLAGTGGYPGIIFAGSSDYSFCSDPGGCPERSSVTGWVVGGSVYPERYAPVDSGGRLKTSYEYISSRVLEAGITPVVITELTSGLENGVYKVSGNLDTPSGTYTFTVDKDYLFLIEGDLNINGNIKVPVGSTATFVVRGNIIVNEGVGQLDYNSTTTNIEGLYSAGSRFVLNGTGDCATERRLNMAGNLVINAGLSGGTFQNERDLCEGNSTCPVFSITERPDFILNAPELIKHSTYIWQEVAP